MLSPGVLPSVPPCTAHVAWLHACHEHCCCCDLTWHALAFKEPSLCSGSTTASHLTQVQPTKNPVAACLTDEACTMYLHGAVIFGTRPMGAVCIIAAYLQHHNPVANKLLSLPGSRCKSPGGCAVAEAYTLSWTFC